MLHAAAPAPASPGPPALPDPALGAPSRLRDLFAGGIRLLEFAREETVYRAAFGSPPGAACTALSPRERRVLGLLVHGRCQKEIAYDLGVAVTTVSSHVRSALDKLGLRCWEQAVLVTSLLERSVATAGEPGAAPGLRSSDVVEVRGHLCPVVLSRLSSAERAVALLLVDGLTNAEIAALRRTSPRTVANQVASMFHKVRVQRRLEFIRRLTVAADVASWPPLRSGTTF